MLIFSLAFLTGCFAGPFSYDYYDYPEVAYNNNNKDVLRMPLQIGRAKLDNDHVGGGEQGSRMSVGVSPTVDEPLLGGMMGPMGGGGGSAGGASGLSDEPRGGVRSNIEIVGGSELNYEMGGNLGGVGSADGGGGGSFGGGSNVDGGGTVDGGDGLNGITDDGFDGSNRKLGGVADYTGADYTDTDYLDLDKGG